MITSHRGLDGFLNGGEIEKVDVSIRVIQTQGILRGILVGGRDV
jgi:hypothetical protein